jgi:hypothetical protein
MRRSLLVAWRSVFSQVPPMTLLSSGRRRTGSSAESHSTHISSRFLRAPPRLLRAGNHQRRSRPPLPPLLVRRTTRRFARAHVRASERTWVFMGSGW